MKNMKEFIIRNLSVRYSDDNESLKNISMEIESHAITVLFGPAGGGKSTFLSVLNRLNDLADVKEMKGEVMFHERNILDAKEDVIQLAAQDRDGLFTPGTAAPFRF